MTSPSVRRPGFRPGNALLVCGLACACAAGPAVPAERPEPVARARQIMGAPLEIRAFVTSGRDAGEVARALDAALDEVERLDSVLSNWREESEISRVNRVAAAGPVVCSAELFELLSESLAAAAVTGRAFDPSIEPWVQALGLREDRPENGPPPRLEESPPAGGGAPPPTPRGGEVRLDPASRTVSFTSAGVGLDLGGIGKGYALDRAAGVLRQAGVASALLNFGGQVLAVGSPPGEAGWIVEVADPRDRQRPVIILHLRDASASTSANTERGVRRSGRWIGHVLDPATGEPASFPGSATAVAPDATRADAYSTALLVMGPEGGVRWAEGRDDVAVVFLGPSADGALQTWATPSMERYRGAGR